MQILAHRAFGTWETKWHELVSWHKNLTMETTFETASSSWYYGCKHHTKLWWGQDSALTCVTCNWSLTKHFARRTKHDYASRAGVAIIALSNILVWWRMPSPKQHSLWARVRHKLPRASPLCTQSAHAGVRCGFWLSIEDNLLEPLSFENKMWTKTRIVLFMYFFKIWLKLAR